MKFIPVSDNKEFELLQLLSDAKLSPEDRLEKSRKINEALWPEIFNVVSYQKKEFKLRWIPK
jgi:hypothetical protein